MNRVLSKPKIWFSRQEGICEKPELWCREPTPDTQMCQGWGPDSHLLTNPGDLRRRLCKNSNMYLLITLKFF